MSRTAYSHSSSDDGRKPFKQPDSILDFVSSFSRNDLDALYTDAFAVMTMFQSFPALSKQVILRLVGLGDLSLPMPMLKTWLKSSESVQSTFEGEFKRLTELNVVQITEEASRIPGSTPQDRSASSDSHFRGVKLHSAFRDCLMKSIVSTNTESAGLSATAPIPSSEDYRQGARDTSFDADDDASDEPFVSKITIDLQAMKRWSSILTHMVGVAAPHAQPPSDIKEYLIEAGLMVRRTSSDVESVVARLGQAFKSTRGSIPSQRGVAFLLKPLRSQLWELITGLVEDTVKLSGGRDDTLRFLFRLSFASHVQRLRLDVCTEAQKTFVLRLAQLGVVYIPSQTSNYYYPTFLANALSDTALATPAYSHSTDSPESSSEEAKFSHDLTPAMPDQRFVVIETSMKLYAYTTSNFMIALMSIFARLDFRLPNMIAGIITRESVKRILLNGLTAADLIAWLTRHAHPKLVARAEGTVNAQGLRVPGTGHIVPLNVAEQIQLWQEERHRLNVVDAVLVEDFASVDEFEHWAAYVRKENMALYIDSKNRKIVLKQPRYEQFKQEVLAWRARTKASTVQK